MVCFQNASRIPFSSLVSLLLCSLQVLSFFIFIYIHNFIFKYFKLMHVILTLFSIISVCIYFSFLYFLQKSYLHFILLVIIKQLFYTFKKYWHEINFSYNEFTFCPSVLAFCFFMQFSIFVGKLILSGGFLLLLFMQLFPLFFFMHLFPLFFFLCIFHMGR